MGGSGSKVVTEVITEVAKSTLSNLLKELLVAGLGHDLKRRVQVTGGEDNERDYSKINELSQNRISQQWQKEFGYVNVGNQSIPPGLTDSSEIVAYPDSVLYDPNTPGLDSPKDYINAILLANPNFDKLEIRRALLTAFESLTIVWYNKNNTDWEMYSSVISGKQCPTSSIGLS